MIDFVRKAWALKQAKIVFAAICVIAVLMSAFFLAPGTKKRLAQGSSAAKTSSSESSQHAESDSEASEASSDVESSSSVQSSASASGTEKDKYQTDLTPSGKPAPVEPEDGAGDKSKTYMCTLSIRCDTILDNMDMLNKDKLPVLPQNGTILQTTAVTFTDGENVFDVLKRVTREYRIHMEFKWTPIYNSVYIQGIHNLYEFDCGNLSGWMYNVNDWFPNYGASRYALKNGDVIEWIYTCDLGKDIGGGYAVGGNSDGE